VPYMLCAAMMTVHVFMVLSEEPWLEAIYGVSCRRYCNRKPRFFQLAAGGGSRMLMSLLGCNLG